MSKTKQDYLNDLVLIAFRMDEKANRQHERTKKIQNDGQTTMMEVDRIQKKLIPTDRLF